MTEKERHNEYLVLHLYCTSCLPHPRHHLLSALCSHTEVVKGARASQVAAMLHFENTSRRDGRPEVHINVTEGASLRR